MKKIAENRFVEEVEFAAQGNPNIDMKQVREWQEIARILEQVPPPPESEEAKPTRLQPIPLRMFSR